MEGYNTIKYGSIKRCAGCIHFDLCYENNLINSKTKCKFYADRDNYIKLPCKIGDKIYEVKSIDKCMLCAKKITNSCDKKCPMIDDTPKIVERTFNMTWFNLYTQEFYDDNVFVTKEEAECYAERLQRKKKKA